jgi:hypothetical protein
MVVFQYHAFRLGSPAWHSSGRVQGPYYIISRWTIDLEEITHFRYDLRLTSNRGSRASQSNHSTTSGRSTNCFNSDTVNFCSSVWSSLHQSITPNLQQQLASVFLSSPPRLLHAQLLLPCFPHHPHPPHPTNTLPACWFLHTVHLHPLLLLVH